METDPDELGYRLPQPGERLWHGPWQQWVTVRNEVTGLGDEIAVWLADGRVAIVKLCSLEEQ